MNDCSKGPVSNPIDPLAICALLCALGFKGLMNRITS